jgi:hypothetical protein
VHIIRAMLQDHLLAAFTAVANSRLQSLFIQLLVKLQKPEDLATQMGCQPKYQEGAELSLIQLVRFLVAELTHSGLNSRFDMNIIFTANYSFSEIRRLYQ